jgi:hypothetical protein
LHFSSASGKWTGIADEYKHRWQMLKRRGALDGKHIRSIPLAYLGSHYYNYKQFHSIVFVISMNVNYELILVNVGKNGQNGGVFQYMWFYQVVGKNL